MESLLARLRDRWGSAEDYVRAAGVDDGAIARLRTALVE